MGLSIWQLALIVLAVIILFGFRRLPSAMGDLGKGIKNFKKELNSVTEDKKTDAQDDDKKEN